MIKKNIAIIGANDSLTGQILNFFSKRNKKNIHSIISKKTPLKRIDTKINKKIEYVKNKKIFNINFHMVKSYKDFIKKNSIKKIYLIEDNNNERLKIYKDLNKHVKFLNFIHPNCFLAGNNKIGEGTIIFPNNYIGYKTNIGKLSIVQSNCILEHHNEIGDFCDINPGLITGGFTEIKKLSKINMAVKIINRITVEENCQIGAGSLVLNNTKKKNLYYGVPAKKIRLLK